MTTSMGLGSRLPRGVVLEGSIRGQGDLRVAGEVLGPIEIDGHLVIEAGAAVRGEVRARTITVAGLLEGNATALELVRLEPGARMTGDARAERVSAAQGALLKGRVRTSQERAQLERMRRTTGGTLLAPFSSSGSILSPLERSSSGELAAPSSSGALHAPTLDAFAEAAVARVTREAVIDARDRATVATPPHAHVATPSAARAQEARAQEARAQEARAQEARAQEARAQEARAQEARAQEARAQEARAQEARAQEARAQEARAQEARAQEARAQERAAEARAEQARAAEARALEARLAAQPARIDPESDTPPPPVMPSIGRRRAQRRSAVESPS